MTPSGGASANLSAGTATIGAGGLASVTATANGTVGSYTVTVSARGVGDAGRLRPRNLATAVSVTAVSVGWGTQTAALQTAGDGIRLLPAGRKTDLPWLGIDQVSITLGAAATLTAGDVTVTSAIGVNYGPVTVSGSGTSYTITLAQPIDKADRVTITIGSASIATFTRRLDVLPGDFNDDGVVNSQDLVGVRNEMAGLRRGRADHLRRHQRRRHCGYQRLQRREEAVVHDPAPLGLKRPAPAAGRSLMGAMRLFVINCGPSLTERSILAPISGKS